MQEAGGIVPEIDKKVREDWAEIERIVKDNPYSLNWGPIRPQTPRMRGLHPDYATFAGKSRAKAGKRTQKPVRTAEFVPADKAGWQLAFQDDFQRDKLGDDWRILDGEWSVKAGYLRGSGALITTRGFPGGGRAGYLRMEFEAATDVDVPDFLKNAPRAAARVGDLSSMIHLNPDKAKDRPFAAGYFCQFGGNWNRRNQIAKMGHRLELEKNPSDRIVPDKRHYIVVENDAGDLRMFVDRKPVIVARDNTPLMDNGFDRVGFYFYTAAKVFYVKVYVKRVANDLDLE